MRKTAVYRDDLFLEHQPGYGHPESSDRLRVIYDELDKKKVGDYFVCMISNHHVELQDPNLFA